MRPSALEHGFPDDAWVRELVRQALAEDVGAGDVSTALTVGSDARAKGQITARREGVVAGLPLLWRVWGELSSGIRVAAAVRDGTPVSPGQRVARVSGPAAPLLTGERTALNFLQHLSGIATLTARYVAVVAGTGCRVLDTRKTVPGWRSLAKYAVRAGGGHNHRQGLYDRVLIKDNHWAASRGGVPAAVARARRERPDLVVEVEVDCLEQLEAVLPLGVDWILLDNFDPPGVRAAVARRDAADPKRRTRLEVSGNVTLETARAYAQAGADAVSVGRLTHSAPALDLGLDLETVAGGKDEE